MFFFTPKSLALKITGCFNLLLTLLILSSCQSQKKTPAELPPQDMDIKARGLRGVFVSNVNSYMYRSKEVMNHTLKDIQSYGLNAVFPVIWNKNHIFIQSEHLKNTFGTVYTEHSAFNISDIISTFISLAHGKGLAVYLWPENGLSLYVGNRPGFIQHNMVRLFVEKGWVLTNSYNKHIELCSPNKCLAYFNVAHSGFRDFYVKLLVEAAVRYKARGVMLDDHFSIPADFGCSHKFTASNRLSSCYGSHQRHIQGIQELLRQLRNQLSRHGKKLYLSPAGGAHWSKQNYSQDWSSAMKNGYVDGVVVQAYRSLTKFRSMISLAEFRNLSRYKPLGFCILTGLEAGTKVSGQDIFEKSQYALSLGYTPSYFHYHGFHQLAPGESKAQREYWLSRLKKLLRH